MVEIGQRLKRRWFNTDSFGSLVHLPLFFHLLSSPHVTAISFWAFSGAKFSVSETHDLASLHASSNSL
jgi:hypothetical protein